MSNKPSTNKPSTSDFRIRTGWIVDANMAFLLLEAHVLAKEDVPHAGIAIWQRGKDWVRIRVDYNGISGAVMPGGELNKKIKTWKKMASDYGSNDVSDGIVVAQLDQPNNWVYLDPHSAKKGEMEAVRWLSGSSDRYPSFLAYLESVIKFCKKY